MLNFYQFSALRAIHFAKVEQVGVSLLATQSMDGNLT